MASTSEQHCKYLPETASVVGTPSFSLLHRWITIRSYRPQDHRIFFIQTSFFHREREHPILLEPSIASFDPHAVMNSLAHLRKYDFQTRPCLIISLLVFSSPKWIHHARIPVNVDHQILGCVTTPCRKRLTSTTQRDTRQQLRISPGCESASLVAPPGISLYHPSTFWPLSLYHPGQYSVSTTEKGHAMTNCCTATVGLYPSLFSRARFESLSVADECACMFRSGRSRPSI